MDSVFTVHGDYKVYRKGYSTWELAFESKVSWKEIFSLISPYLVEHPNDTAVKLKLAQSLLEREGKEGSSVSINDQEFKTITVQLKAYGLINTNYLQTTKGGMALFWSLTKKGEQQMMESRIIRNSA